MTSEKWQAAWMLYGQVAALEDDEREVAIREATDDPEIIACLLHVLSSTGGTAAQDILAAFGLEGTTLGKYELRQKIGQGGMGVIYEGWDDVLGRKVAIKVISTKQVGPNAIHRFTREARAASSLNHPNIVTIYDILRDGDILAIVMELVDGQTLRLAYQAGLPLDTVCDYVKQVATALSAAHAGGIVHQDVKPENVMVRKDGLVKLLDFGIAGLLGTEPDTRPAGESASGAKATTVAGTLRYLAPEQLDRPRVSAAADIYALGLVLYEGIVGTHPWEGYTQLSLIERGDRPAVASLQAQRPGTPASLDRLVHRMTASDPAQRPSPLEVASELALRNRRSWARWWAVAAAAFSVLAIYSYVTKLGEDHSTGQNLEFASQPLTALTGDELGSTFDPTGRLVAFAWNGEQEESFNIYVKSVSGPDIRRITNTPANDFTPEWSHDGEKIAFLRNFGPDHAEIVVHWLKNGEERVVAPVHAAAGPSYFQRLDWTADDRRIVYADVATPENIFTLFETDLTSGKVQRLLTPPGGTFYHQPAVSPTGDVAFVADKDGVGQIGILSADRKSPPWLLKLKDFGKAHCQSPRWSVDGKSLFFTSNRDSSDLRLFAARVPRDRNSEATALRAGVTAESLLLPNFSADGKKLVYTLHRNDIDTYRLNLANNSLTKILASTRSEHFSRYSPDGQRIAFESDRSGHPEVWLANADGSNAFALTNTGGTITGSPAWSPDGRWIAFDSRAGGQPDIYVVESRQGATPRRITDATQAAVIPSWAADGLSVYFSSSRSGESHIYQATLDGKTKQITDQPSIAPLASRDGKWLYFTNWDRDLFRLNIATGIIEKIVHIAEVRSYCLGAQGVYYFSYADKKRADVYYWDAQTRRSSKLTTLDGAFESSLSASPDEKGLLVQWIKYDGNDLVLVDPFRFRP